MSINSVINAVKYSEELDKVFAQKSVTGFFADNALAAKFVGAKTVIIPDIDFQGLADYDRNSGYTKGAITVSNTSHTMSMDRARSLQIDREDMDETGIANLAGKILGEYVRTKVVPECDAYVLSKMASIAMDMDNTVDGDAATPLASLHDLICEVQSRVGYDEELVAFVNSGMYAQLQASDELNRSITVSDFKQGEVNLKVQSFNGVAILPVVNERMKTEFVFNDTEIGGFKPAADCRDIYMLVCPKSAVHLVKKTESMRIFTPEQNVDADAYKFDYRIYYDAFVNRNDMNSIFAWVSPVIEFTAEPEDATASVGGQAVLSADVEGATAYQWFSCDANKSFIKRIANATADSYTFSDTDEKGEYHFFLRAYLNNFTYKDSEVVTVKVQ